MTFIMPVQARMRLLSEAHRFDHDGVEMNHILIPTDLSEGSFKAAMFAFDLFGSVDTKYTLVHTYLKPSYNNVLLPKLGRTTQGEAMNGLRRFERRCRKYAGKVVIGRKASHFQLTDVLNALVRDKGAAIVVMGTQGEGNYGLVGRNTVAVVSDSIAPVIAVPSNWVPAPVGRIMLAHDGGHVEGSTIEPLVRIAKHKGAEVVIAHVRVESDPVSSAGFKVGSLLQDVEHSKLTVKGKQVVDRINELANQHGIQLVAVVHRQMGFWKGLFHSSKAKRMALHTSIPLLVMTERPPGSGN